MASPPGSRLGRTAWATRLIQGHQETLTERGWLVHPIRLRLRLGLAHSGHVSDPPEATQATQATRGRPPGPHKPPATGHLGYPGHPVRAVDSLLNKIRAAAQKRIAILSLRHFSIQKKSPIQVEAAASFGVQALRRVHMG